MEVGEYIIYFNTFSEINRDKWLTANKPYKITKIERNFIFHIFDHGREDGYRTSLIEGNDVIIIPDSTVIRAMYEEE